MNYFIAFTGRSGSSLLCDMLGKTNQLGRPMEYFCLDAKGGLIGNKLWDCSSRLRHYQEYQRHTHTPNGVTAAKTSWEQWQSLLVGLGGPPAVDLWVWLRRRDKLRQAISSYKAAATGICERRDATPVPDPPFAPDRILALAQGLSNQETLWKALLPPSRLLEMWYEDWIDRPELAVQAVADHIGAGPIEALPSDHRKMANDASESWYHDLLPRWRAIVGCEQQPSGRGRIDLEISQP